METVYWSCSRKSNGQPMISKMKLYTSRSHFIAGIRAFEASREQAASQGSWWFKGCSTTFYTWEPGDKPRFLTRKRMLEFLAEEDE